MSDEEILDAAESTRPQRRRRRPRLRLRPRPGSRWPSVLAVAAGIVALAVIVVTVTAGWVVQRPMPTTEGSLAVNGLDDEVDVVRDARGVPTVTAATSHDLFFAQGYVQAQDRFWEMDVRRHITAGRLSEMFGDSQVETDTFVRTLGWRRVAEAELELLSPETTAALSAYADGVNAYLADRSPGQISLEYTLLGATAPGYEIEPWTPADSVSWLKAMAWDLRANLDEETDRALLLPIVGARVSDLYPPYPADRHQPIVAGGFEPSNRDLTVDPQHHSTASPGLAPLLRNVRSGAESLDEWLGAYGPGVGSNSFAVTGARSASGGALLANDPHLAPSLPGIWYQMTLRCSETTDECPYDVSGFTFAGTPGVIIGHNDHVAWGFTNNGSDVADLAYEGLNDDRYVRDGRLRPLDTREETIEVAGADPVTITVRSTDWGPLISDVSDDHGTIARDTFDVATLPARADEVAVALRWTALMPGRTADAILRLDLASNFDEFRLAARSFEVPSQNMLYADTDGHIGYQMPGRIPVRGAGDGTLPVSAWDPSSAWKGYLDFADLPWVFDPPEQYIVAANQAVVGAEYPYFLTNDWAYGYRSQRLADMIEASAPLTPQSAASLMYDDTNTFAPEVIEKLMEVPEDLLNPAAREARAMLTEWDHQQGKDSAPAAYYNAVWRHMLELIYQDELTGDLAPDGGDRWFEVVRGLFIDDRVTWWDDVRTDNDVELRDQVLAEAMNDAADELVDRLGSDQSDWAWGDLHQLELTHQTLGSSGIAPLEMLFNRGPYATAGGESIVNATGWDAAKGYDVTWVPSMRMVVDLTDLDASRWVQLTGQSGHVFDPHYTDQTQAWADGETYPWPFSEAAVVAAEADRLALTPAP